MRSLQYLQLINRNALRVFTMRDFLALSGLSPASGAQVLKRLAEAGILTKLKRGVWLNNSVADINLCEAAAPLCFPYPAYISLHTALNHYGIIDQIPTAIYVVTTGKTAEYRTAQSDYKYHHLQPKLFWGYNLVRGKQAYYLAGPEKAILDTLYLQHRAGKGISLFPELNMEEINVPILKQMAKRFGDVRVSEALTNIIS